MTDIAHANLAHEEVRYIDTKRKPVPDINDTPVTIEIKSAGDIVTARQQGRLLAHKLGFSTTQTTLVATVISELARNILVYAGRGEIVLTRLGVASGQGLQIQAADSGPGIVDIERALRSGYSSSGGLGLGLSGIRQMVDDFDIKSDVVSGTLVTASMRVR